METAEGREPREDNRRKGAQSAPDTGLLLAFAPEWSYLLHLKPSIWQKPKMTPGVRSPGIRIALDFQQMAQMFLRTAEEQMYISLCPCDAWLHDTACDTSFQTSKVQISKYQHENTSAMDKFIREGQGWPIHFSS